MLPQILEYIVILCIERRFSKQFAWNQTFWPHPKFLVGLRHCLRVNKHNFSNRVWVHNLLYFAVAKDCNDVLNINDWFLMWRYRCCYCWFCLLFDQSFGFGLETRFCETRSHRMQVSIMDRSSWNLQWFFVT